jgi:hypothetical protein
MKSCILIVLLVNLIIGLVISQTATCTSEVTLFKEQLTRKHPRVINEPGPRTTAISAKFLSLSSRPLSMWWDDGGDGVPQGTLPPGQESSTNSYEGHVFYFTEKNNKNNIIARVTMQNGKVYCKIIY